MAARTSVKSATASRAKRPAVTEADVSAARLAHIGTHGLGADTDDLSFFVGLDPIEQSHIIRDGMEAIIVQRIAKEWLHVPVQSLLASLRLPSSTISRKIMQGERLNASEADRAARTLLIYAHARDVLEDDQLAAEWLKHPHIELRGERPIDMLDTQSGYDRVRDILMRIEYGIAV